MHRLFRAMFLLFALLTVLPGCASQREAERNPGTRLRRSDALYAREDFGDPARRRERGEPGAFSKFGKSIRDVFTTDDNFGGR